MNISMDFVGTFTEHPEFFREFALAMQSRGHKVGIIANEREKHVDTGGIRIVNERERIERELGFTPDFLYLWGETETIANGNLWKAQRMDQEDVLLHFDDDAYEIKKYTGRWCLKVMNSGQIDKF